MVAPGGKDVSRGGGVILIRIFLKTPYGLKGIERTQFCHVSAHYNL